MAGDAMGVFKAALSRLPVAGVSTHRYCRASPVKRSSMGSFWQMVVSLPARSVTKLFTSTKTESVPAQPYGSVRRA